MSQGTALPRSMIYDVRQRRSVPRTGESCLPEPHARRWEARRPEASGTRAPRESPGRSRRCGERFPWREWHPLPDATRESAGSERSSSAHLPPQRERCSSPAPRGEQWEQRCLGMRDESIGTEKERNEAHDLLRSVPALKVTHLAVRCY